MRAYATVLVALLLTTPSHAQVQPFSRGDRVLLAEWRTNLPAARAQIVALPGDYVEISSDAIVVNGQRVHNPWVNSFRLGLPTRITARTVPSGSYFIVAERQMPQPDRFGEPASSTYAREIRMTRADNLVRKIE